MLSSEKEGKCCDWQLGNSLNTWFQQGQQQQESGEYTQMWINLVKYLWPKIDDYDVIVPSKQIINTFRQAFKSFTIERTPPEQSDNKKIMDNISIILSSQVERQCQSLYKKMQPGRRLGLIGSQQLKYVSIPLRIPTEDKDDMLMDRYNSFASSSETTLVLKFEHIVLDKFKTSILKRDRELKKEFIEKYLFSEQKFCFNLKKVSVLQYPEKTFVELDHQNDQIFILYEGIILRRKSKAGVIIASSQLTKGSWLNYRIIANMFDHNTKDCFQETFQITSKACIVGYEAKQIKKLIQCSPCLFEALEQSLIGVQIERQFLIDKALKTRKNISNYFIEEKENLHIHFPIQFEARSVISKRPKRVSNTFRKTYTKKEKYEDYSNIMTLAKYHIAIDSKHKVMFRKNFFYDNKLEETAQPFVPGRNKIGQEKMKAKAKIITMQSFKIQKIAKNDTASMNSQEIVGIKRHLLKLNNIFEDTMDQEKMINFYGHASNGTTASTDFPDDRQARLTHDRNEQLGRKSSLDNSKRNSINTFKDKSPDKQMQDDSIYQQRYQSAYGLRKT